MSVNSLFKLGDSIINAGSIEIVNFPIADQNYNFQLFSDPNTNQITERNLLFSFVVGKPGVQQILANATETITPVSVTVNLGQFTNGGVILNPSGYTTPANVGSGKCYVKAVINFAGTVGEIVSFWFGVDGDPIGDALLARTYTVPAGGIGLLELSGYCTVDAVTTYNFSMTAGANNIDIQPLNPTTYVSAFLLP